MNKEDLSQLELFSQGNGSQQAGRNDPAFSVSFLSYIRLYEKVIFVLIGFLVTAVIAFCFGVERGKTMAKEVTNARMDVAQAPVQAGRPVALPAAAAPKAAPAAVVPLKQYPVVPQPGMVASRRVNAPVAAAGTVQVAAINGGYTIQVGSYAESGLAMKESANLKKKGFNALLVRKGKYMVLCVGNFTSKENAQSVLSQLKRTYGDCYIRRL